MYDLKKMVLDATAYVSGYINKDDKYVISASMVGKEILQNYLSILHGKIESSEISDMTLGSVFHKGMEDIARDKQLEDVGEKDSSTIWGIEHSMYVDLPNGWVLSGTADLITEPTPGNFEIRDYKLTKSFSHKKFLEDKYNSDYTTQLQVLEALFREGNNRPEVIENVDLICDFFVKDAKAINYELTHRPEYIPRKKGTEDMRAAEVTLAEVVAITDSLQAYLESGEIPPECTDKWKRNIKGNIINTKCAFWCSHNKHCPYYDPSTRSSVNKLVGW